MIEPEQIKNPILYKGEEIGYSWATGAGNQYYIWLKFSSIEALEKILKAPDTDVLEFDGRRTVKEFKDDLKNSKSCIVHYSSLEKFAQNQRDIDCILISLSGTL